MPIRQLLDGRQFDPETMRVMGLAFEITRAALHVADADDADAEIITRKIRDLAQKGERDPELLSELALASLRVPNGADGSTSTIVCWDGSRVQYRGGVKLA